ncbi:MAG TPA: ABC transporter permease subunit [Candidatus Saccharimonadales bacterium]|nr:ABC transporter permease subunit [Candidatus Saccharimonadales bacterium]
MRPVARWTIWQRRWSIFWWSFGVLFFIFLTLIFYPTIKHQSAQLDKSFDQIPQTAKQLFTDTNDIFSPVGYLSSQIFYLLLPLLLGILAISQGMSLIGKEERDNTIEMLLARPISRLKLLWGKAAAGLLIVVFVGVLSSLFTALMCKLVGLGVATGNVLQAGAAAGLLGLCLGAIAFMLTALGRAGRAASIGIAAFIGLGGYILVSLAPTVTWLRWPAKIFPFDYYHSSELLTGNYSWWNAVYFVGVIIGCIVISGLAFRRRDLAGN